jgi:hypothetical protein
LCLTLIKTLFMMLNIYIRIIYRNISPEHYKYIYLFIYLSPNISLYCLNSESRKKLRNFYPRSLTFLYQFSLDLPKHEIFAIFSVLLKFDSPFCDFLLSSARQKGIKKFSHSSEKKNSMWNTRKKIDYTSWNWNWDIRSFLNTFFHSLSDSFSL